MRRGRNPLLTGAIGLAVLAGLLVAAFNIDDLPLIGGGTGYAAAFRDASGLAPGNEVRVADSVVVRGKLELRRCERKYSNRSSSMRNESSE